MLGVTLGHAALGSIQHLHVRVSASLLACRSLDRNYLLDKGAAELAKVLPECKALVSLRCVLAFLCRV